MGADKRTARITATTTTTRCNWVCEIMYKQRIMPPWWSVSQAGGAGGQSARLINNHHFSSRYNWQVCLLVDKSNADDIEKGRALQLQFGRRITAGLDEASMETLRHCLATVNSNLEQMLQGLPAETEGTQC